MAPIAATAVATPAAPSPRVADGQWFYATGEDGFVSATFGVPESEGVFGVACDTGNRTVRIIREVELSPDQPVMVRVETAMEALEFQGHSFNEGLPSVSADVAAPDERLAALARAEGHFVVRVKDDAITLPMDEAVSRAIGACLG